MNSATEAYNAARAKTSILLAQLTLSLNAHDERQGSDSKNWGLVGNLNEINTRLSDAVAFLGVPKPVAPSLVDF